MLKPLGRRIYIQEVSARDGFQAEATVIPTEEKIRFINRLSHTGLAKIEVTSFTAPKAVPTLADADIVMRGITRIPDVLFTGLVPNLHGCERALAAEVDEVNLVMSASESHNRANIRMSCSDSLRQFREIVRRVGTDVEISASLSTSFGCPFEGEVPPQRVFELIGAFLDFNICKISLCDTTGMANPAQVESLFSAARQRWPQVEFTAHFHNTRGMGLANVLAALEAGIDRFDSSLCGLGGCPFAPGATGNICTEDLVHMLQAMGYRTGVDLEALLQVARDLPTLVGHEVPGQLIKAGPSTRRYSQDSARPQNS